MKLVPGIFRAALILIFSATAWAQSNPVHNGSTSVQTFYLKNSTQIQDRDEILHVLRNILTSETKMSFVSSQNAIVLETTPDQIAIARKLIDDLDRPQQTYRLTYTIVDWDGARRIGEQHYSMIVAPGQRTQLKEGSRVPIMVNDAKGSSGAAAVTYIDVGMNFEATLAEVSGGASLKTRVERSSIAAERSGVTSQDPIVRQSLIEGTSFLTPGRSLTIGSFDIPDTTRHLDIAVKMEPMSAKP